MSYLGMHITCNNPTQTANPDPEDQTTRASNREEWQEELKWTRQTALWFQLVDRTGNLDYLEEEIYNKTSYLNRLDK